MRAVDRPSIGPSGRSGMHGDARAAIDAIDGPAMASTYVVCEKDNAVPVFAQEAMSQRASRVERLPSGHSPFLSCPTELTRLLIDVES